GRGERGGVQSLQPERAERLEQAVPRRAAVLLDDDQRAIDKSDQEVQHVRRLEAASAPDALRGLEAKAASENTQSVEEQLLARGQELVAPLDRGAQRLVSDGRRATATAEQSESIVQSVRDLLDAEHAH